MSKKRSGAAPPRPYEPPRIGVRPKWAEVWSKRAERAVQIILPRGTRRELAESAVRGAVLRWLEALDRRGLRLVSGVKVIGPYSCFELERFGDDMYIAKAAFDSDRPRLVREDVVVASRRQAEALGIDYETWRNAQSRALPDDVTDQLTYVTENEDQVYDDLRDAKKKEGQTIEPPEEV